MKLTQGVVTLSHICFFQSVTEEQVTKFTGFLLVAEAGDHSKRAPGMPVDLVSKLVCFAMESAVLIANEQAIFRK